MLQYCSDVMLHSLAILCSTLEPHHSSLNNCVYTCVENLRESISQLCYKLLYLNIHSLDSLEVWTEWLVSSVCSWVWLSEISLHQQFSLVWSVHSWETVGSIDLRLSFGPYPAMHWWTSIDNLTPFSYQEDIPSMKV